MIADTTQRPKQLGVAIGLGFQNSVGPDWGLTEESVIDLYSPACGLPPPCDN
jgi:hypothetical protein